jgi:hypothetical protein
MYTFWDYMRNRWERDGGLRLDHILLSPALAIGLEAGGVDRDVRGKDNASDHAPVWAVSRDDPLARRSVSTTADASTVTAARTRPKGSRRRADWSPIAKSA